MFWEMYAAALLALATKEAIEKTYAHVCPPRDNMPPAALDGTFSRSESDDGHYANL
mgnify:CR=1 FL=1